MDLASRIEAFSILGKLLVELSTDDPKINYKTDKQRQNCEALRLLIDESRFYNNWFTPENVRYMLKSIGHSLDKNMLGKWLQPYLFDIEKVRHPTKIGVVMAGNIPAVGFHDFLSVLISGNILLAKLSSGDNKFLPAMADLLISIHPEFGKLINFTEDKLSDFDAVIATGSNNSSRYFDYYFNKYPHIIRSNRNGIAILDGTESRDELKKLSEDIFLYFGLGCRNVSRLLVIENYDFSELLEILSQQKKVIENSKYFNNYEYYKAIFLINGTPHFDTGNLLLHHDENLSSPVGVLNFSYFPDKNWLSSWIFSNEDKIQCVVSKPEYYSASVPFGQSQRPELWDYADGVDTIKFILTL